MSIIPKYNTKNGKDYVDDKPLVTLTRKEGLMYINGRNLIEILENSSADIELVRKTFVKICVTPNLAAAAVELKKEGYVPIQISIAFSAIFNMGKRDAFTLFENLCYPAIVDWIESEFNNKLNNKIVALRELATARPLAEAEQLELSIFERLQTTNDIRCSERNKKRSTSYGYRPHITKKSAANDRRKKGFVLNLKVVCNKR